MKYSNLKDLRNNLSDKVFNLGIDPKFKENPAYERILYEINSLIYQMSVEEPEKVTIKEGNNKIEFSCKSIGGEEYSMIITSTSPETFKCVRIHENLPSYSTNGQLIREKDALEKIVTISEEGFITLTTSNSMIDNFNCKSGICNNTTSAEEVSYTPEGVMSVREYKGYRTGPLSKSVDNADVDSMLFLPRMAFNSKFWDMNYENRELYRRHKLDTAYVLIENKSIGLELRGEIPIHQEHGLSDLTFQLVYERFMDGIDIPCISSNQIEEMLEKEKNPKVVEGLRKYAKDRENYSYNSKNDPHFKCIGIDKLFYSNTVEQAVEQMAQGVDVLGEHTDENTQSNTRTMGFAVPWVLGLITGIVVAVIVIFGIVLIK